MNNPAENPYVGTRTFSEEDAPRFFGREREARDLLALVAFEQVVLFYAQSGTGKSSLVNTQLIPGLEKDGRFEVLTPSRVTGEIPPDAAIENVYVYSLIQNLTSHTVEPELLAGMRIKDFLPKLVRDTASAKRSFMLGGTGNESQKPKRRVLIIDQFEELFTTHPEEWESRSDFFEQLAAALDADPNLWVVLVMREDYIAYLDPYAHLMPEGLRVRYYMQKMDYDDALKAVKRPAENAGRPYQEGVAEQLVDDLRGRQLRRRAGKKQTVLGQYVEPIVLQAVCSTLWENLDPGNTPITISDLKKLGNVNKALGKYYEKRVHEVAIMDEVKKLGIRESEIRNWIGTQLITSDGRRNIVVRNAGSKSGGLDDSVIQLFSKKKDLIWEEGHGAASIYELTHDRLAEPILENNKEWEKEHGFPFHPQVILWSEARGRGKEVHLLSEMALGEAEKWVSQNPDQLSNLESEFLDACRAKKLEEEKQKALELQRQEQEREYQRQKLESAQKLAEEQARFAQQLRRALRTSTIIAGIAWLTIVIAIALGIQSNRNQRTTQMQVLLNASSIELPQDERLGTMLAYQALKQFGEHGEVEQAVANILYDMNDRVRAESPFIITTTINGAWSIAFNPTDGGQTLAAGYSDGTIYLMDMATYGSTGDPLSGHTANVASLSFSPDGKMLASGSWDNTIILWDVETRQPIGQPLSGHTGQVTSVAFSPDGKMLASGSWDNTIILWDVETKQAIGRPLTGHSNFVTSVAFSPDGDTLASGSLDSTVILWSVAALEKIGTLLDTGPINAIAFNRDGNILASGGSTYNGPITLWDVATQEPMEEPFVEGGFVTSLAFSPDGGTLASGGYRTISLWDVATRQRNGDPLIDFNNNVTSLTFSPDGTTLAGISNIESDIILWDVATRSKEASIPAPVQQGKLNVAAMSISSTGEIQGITSTKLMVWHGDNAPPETLDFDAANPAQSLESIYRLDLITYKISAFSLDGKYRIDRIEGSNNIARVVDAANEDHISQVGHGTTITAVAFSRQGDDAASADKDYVVLVWDPKSGRVKARLFSEKNYGTPVSLSFSPDASRIAIAYADEQSSVEVWDIETKQKILVIANRQFQPLGYTVAASAGLFDSKDNEPVESDELQNEQIGNPIADIAYLEDGLYILYSNGAFDHWEIWPSRTVLKADMLKICDPCEMTTQERRNYGLYTWPMRVQDYAGYLMTIFMVLVYGFGAHRVYSNVFKNPMPVDQNARPGFTWKKFLSAGAQGAALTLTGLLGCVVIAQIEAIVYSQQAPGTDPTALLLFLLPPLGLWAGGSYSHSTRLQSGRLSRTQRTLVGALAGVLAGSISALLGLITLGYLLTKDLIFIFSDLESILTVLLLSGLVEGLMSLFGALIYIFLLQPWSEGRKITRGGQVLLQLLFGAGMFFEKRKTIRKWIYPIVVIGMIGFLLLVPPFDLDYGYFGGDIVDDGTAALLSLMGFIIHLLGLYDLRWSMKHEDQANAPKSTVGALIAHFFLGIGLFYGGSKSWRRWIYPVAIPIALIGLADLDYTLLRFDIIPDDAAVRVGTFAFLVYILGFIDTWLFLRKINRKTEAEQSSKAGNQEAVDTDIRSGFDRWLQIWWMRGLMAAAAGFVVGILAQYLEQGYMAPGSFTMIVPLSMALGAFGMLFYPHKISYLLLAVLGSIGAFAWFPLVDSISISLWLGLGSGLILSALISRILRATKKI